MTKCPICGKRRKAIGYTVHSLGFDGAYSEQGVPVCNVCLASEDKALRRKIGKLLEKKV